MRHYKVYLLGLISALLVVGCSTSAPEASEEAEPAEEAEEVDVEESEDETEDTEPEEEPAADDSVAGTVTVGSWRVDDVEQFETIVATFNEEYPDVEIIFDPTNPPEYNATLRTQLESGTAWDIFYTRSFSTTRQLYEEGFLEPLDDIEGLQSFTEETRAPWATDDGTPYSVPLLAVSHGIYYNVDLFNELGLEPPDTWEELLVTAEAVQAAGYVPFANASGDEWTMAEIVFMNLAPNYIGGYEGRQAYLNGDRCFNDENVVQAFMAVDDVAPYLPEGQEALAYYDSQQLFLFSEAAMWFGGSWDISFFESEEPDFEWGVFAVPAPEGMDEYVTFHMDAGMGLNAASENQEAAKVFLEWLTTDSAAEVIGNELPGFFPTHINAPELTNEYAAEFLALNEGRGVDVRWAWDGLLEGQPDGYSLMQAGAVGIVNGDLTPEQAADDLQNGLAEWFEPAQTCDS